MKWIMVSRQSMSGCVHFWSSFAQKRATQQWRLRPLNGGGEQRKSKTRGGVGWQRSSGLLSECHDWRTIGA